MVSYAGWWFQKNLVALEKAFTERFVSGPNNWLSSQQLKARKQVSHEPLDQYNADVRPLCQRLKLLDTESLRYVVDGWESDLQAYVSLNRPTSFQQAETLARMRHAVNQEQRVSGGTTLVI